MKYFLSFRGVASPSNRKRGQGMSPANTLS
jgi:hypothetical protein